MLRIRELEVFRRVMELSTITAAAEALRISQPAVSRTLQHAERRLGFPLFLAAKEAIVGDARSPIVVSRVRQRVRGFRRRPEARRRPAGGVSGRTQHRRDFGLRKCVAADRRGKIPPVAA
ncbi:LysR family transcriptional regulator [Bradyrhizobium sp. LjRoot220]|uniref:helix-turn-helix domain-containing protein n=1 Tax=Bradyrhizobium sp. LjRoot220 TaxID=3342284 RepID=UPI003ECEA15F